MWKKCATETTFFYVFNRQESKKDVPLTTFSGAENGLDLLVVKKAATYDHPWKSIISSKFMDRLFYEKCCVLTTWKFIDFHVNQSLDINGNEPFVWVSDGFGGLYNGAKPIHLLWTPIKETCYGSNPRVRNYWLSGFPGHPKTLPESQFFQGDFRQDTL